MNVMNDRTCKFFFKFLSRDEKSTHHTMKRSYGYDSAINVPISDEEVVTRVDDYLAALEAIAQKLPIPIPTPNTVEVVGESEFSVTAARNIKKDELVTYYTGEKLLMTSSRGSSATTHSVRIPRLEFKVGTQRQSEFAIDGFIARVAKVKFPSKLDMNDTNFNVGVGSLINSCFNRNSSFISNNSHQAYAPECNLLLKEDKFQEIVKNSEYFQLLPEMSNQPYTMERPIFLISPFVARRDIDEGEELRWRYPYDDYKQESLIPLMPLRAASAPSSSASTSTKPPKRRIVPIPIG